MTTKKTMLVTANADRIASVANESRYTIDELVRETEKLFTAGTSAELASVALELACKDMFEKTTLTKREAVEIVEKFKKKEVK